MSVGDPVPDPNSEALDFAALSECFAGRRTLRKRDLDALGMITPHYGCRGRTVGEVVLLGRDRLTQFPDAWIQAHLVISSYGREVGDAKKKVIGVGPFRQCGVYRPMRGDAATDRTCEDNS